MIYFIAIQSRNKYLLLCKKKEDEKMETLFNVWNAYDYQKLSKDLQQVYYGIKSPIQVFAEMEINSRLKHIFENIYM